MNYYMYSVIITEYLHLVLGIIHYLHLKFGQYLYAIKLSYSEFLGTNLSTGTLLHS